jgi:ketosteroid isomerase-like protein
MADIQSEIKTALTSYLDAFNECRWNDFADCLTDDFEYYTDHCIIQPKTVFVAFMSKNAWKSKGYELSELRVHSSKRGDLAAAIYKVRFTGSENGKELFVKATETTIF